MCYSAMCKQQYREYVRRFGAKVDLETFAKLYGFKQSGLYIPTAKAMDDSFASAEGPAELGIKAHVAEFRQQQREKLAENLQAQRMRLVGANFALQTKVTKKAQNDQRIATNNVARLEEKLADLDRVDERSSDSRIYPGYYAPLMIWENGQRIVKPMRYLLRPAGMPVNFDTKYPGCYNARRDKLQGFWKDQFGHTHGILLVSRFYENVQKHDFEQRRLEPDEKPQNLVVEFRPQDGETLAIACLWSRWTKPGEEDLLSFAIIMDEPPPEVVAAGHDRCMIAIKEQYIDQWLEPGGDWARYQAILDDRVPLTYVYRPAG